MFSEKALNLEENELREQVRNLEPELRQQYLMLESRWLRSARTYRLLNWLFPLGINHFYLHRWLRGGLNLLLTLAAVYLLANSPDIFHGLLVLLSLLLIEIPQLINSRHLVHSRNNEIRQQCINRVLRDQGARPASS